MQFTDNFIANMISMAGSNTVERVPVEVYKIIFKYHVQMDHIFLTAGIYEWRTLCKYNMQYLPGYSGYQLKVACVAFGQYWRGNIVYNALVLDYHQWATEPSPENPFGFDPRYPDDHPYNQQLKLSNILNGRAILQQEQFDFDAFEQGVEARQNALEFQEDNTFNM